MDANTLVAGCVFGVIVFLYTRLQPKKGKDEQADTVSCDEQASTDISAHNVRFDPANWEIPFYDEKRIRKVVASLLIMYDNNGLVEEVVHVENTDHYLEKSVFRGFCESRQVYDTFFYDFIRSCKDLDTGELVDDVQQYLFSKYELSSEKTVDLISYKYFDLLKAFYCLMSNEGLLNADGIECVRRYFCRLTGDFRLTAEQIETLFTEMPPVSDEIFERAAARVKMDKDIDTREFLHCFEEISSLRDNNSIAKERCRDVAPKCLRRSQRVLRVSGAVGQWLRKTII